MDDKYRCKTQHNLPIKTNRKEAVRLVLFSKCNGKEMLLCLFEVVLVDGSDTEQWFHVSLS